VRKTGTGTLGLIVAFAFVVQVSSAFGSSNYKCKNPACDINAIGHRNLSNGHGVGNWYSSEKQKELGKKYASALEQRVDVVKDPAITGYVDQVAQRVAHNSDADMPITVRIIRSDGAGAFTLFGGHLYVTTGLLMKLQSEGELASVLARGIAHTAMQSVARLQTRAALLQAADMPMIGLDNSPPDPAARFVSVPFGVLKFQRDFELEADYFGIQYVYKSGYDPNCFLDAVQAIWRPEASGTLGKAFSPFPPVVERLKMLQQEIDDILPRQAEASVSTSDFEEFLARLRQIAPPASPPRKDALPKLIRHDDGTND